MFKLNKSANYKPCSLLQGLAVVLIAVFSSTVFGEQHHSVEARVKAAYLYNFLKFVDWPQTNGKGNTETLRVCTHRDDPILATLEGINSLKAKNRSIELIELETDQDHSSCHLLFLSSQYETITDEFVEDSRKHHILLVGDEPGFARKGGVIEFVKQRGKVRLEINLNAAQLSGLKLSSNLLEIARVVHDG